MKNKEAYYFSHDSNARNDQKIIKLRMKYGWEGYGLYWAVIETLRETTDYRIEADYEALAYSLRTDKDTIKSVIEDYCLFVFYDDGYFGSASLTRRMAQKDEKILKQKIAGIKGNLIRYQGYSKSELEKRTDDEILAIADSQSGLSGGDSGGDGNPTATRSQRKERKGKEIKGKEREKERKERERKKENSLSGLSEEKKGAKSVSMDSLKFPQEEERGSSPEVEARRYLPPPPTLEDFKSVLNQNIEYVTRYCKERDWSRKQVMAEWDVFAIAKEKESLDGKFRWNMGNPSHQERLIKDFLQYLGYRKIKAR